MAKHSDAFIALPDLLEPQLNLGLKSSYWNTFKNRFWQHYGSRHPYDAPTPANQNSSRCVTPDHVKSTERYIGVVKELLPYTTKEGLLVLIHYTLLLEKVTEFADAKEHELNRI